MPTRDIIWQWIIDDWRRKLAALFFATIIWLVVTVQLQDRETIRNIPIQIPPAPSLAILNPEDIPTISVTVRGSRRNLQKVTNNNNITIVHRIPSDTDPGLYIAFIRPKDIDLPANLSIVDIQPNAIEVLVDRKQRIPLPVRVRFNGKAPDGMDRKSVVVTPSTVRVTGPGRMLTELTEIVTEPIQLTADIPTSFETEKKLIIPNQDLLSVTPKTVTVTVEMAITNDEKFLADIPVTVIDVPNSPLYIESYLEPIDPRISVVIEGPKTTIDYLNASSVRAFVDISDVRQAEIRTLPVQVHVGLSDCKIRPNSIRPATLKVRIAKRTIQPQAAPAENGPTPNPIPIVPQP